MALLCGASGMRAQQAAAPPAAQAADQLKFSTGAALIVWQVKPDMEAGFESAWGHQDQAFCERQAGLQGLGDSIKIFKVNMTGAPAGSPTAYVFQLNPPSKTLSYDPSKILTRPECGSGGGRCVVRRLRTLW
jgi:hypothetical protein